jgi:pimeloyl-ACP methyl ester carboxylesterase
MTFQTDTIYVGKTKVVMKTAGSGPPLLFMHGAGTASGFDFALPWAEHHRLLIPYHPGWAESGDDATLTTIHDYVMHYLDLIDQLGLAEVDLVGLSMGGRMAAQFTAEHRRRVRKLVLVAPAGLDVPGYPLADFSKIAPEDVLSYLTENIPLIMSRTAAPPDPRDGESFGRLLPSIMNPQFTRWLHRITIPSMLVWGDKDRTTPIQQADEWLKLIPGLQLHRVPGGGHLVLDEQPEVVEKIAEFLREPHA